MRLVRVDVHEPGAPLTVYHTPKNEPCDLCPAPATIQSEDMDGSIASTLCAECYRRVNHREPPTPFRA